jgi:oxygen-dependent protoporphyrinogen oxidase
VGAASDLRILRASIGRHREESSLQASDEELVAHVVEDLSTATRRQLHPVDQHVHRWGGALPQYAVGHLDRVRRARAQLADQPRIALAGAAYDGVGIPACIASGQAAAARITAALDAWPADRQRQLRHG